jgi:hypothetical protein
MYVHNAPGGDADAEVVPLAGAPLPLVLPILRVFRWLGSRGGAATRGPAASTSTSPAASPTPAFATAASTAAIVSGLPFATLLVRSTGLACEEGDRIQKAQHMVYMTGHGRNDARVHRQRLSALHGNAWRSVTATNAWTLHGPARRTGCLGLPRSPRASPCIPCTASCPQPQGQVKTDIQPRLLIIAVSKQAPRGRTQQRVDTCGHSDTGTMSLGRVPADPTT